MGFGSTTLSTEEPRIGALSIRSSAYGLPIPLVWGKTRLNGNMIWYGDFTPIAHTTTESGGGKGGGGVTTKNTSYTYTCAFMLGLADANITSIERVWKDKDKTTFAALGLTLLPGTIPQAVFSHLTTNHPAEALSYPGIACAAHSAFDLGNSASLPNLSFEVNAPRQFGSGIVDARADEIVSDLVSSPISGAGFPAGRLSLGAYRTYTQAEGLFLSPAINSQQPAAQHLDEILAATNSAVLWSEGMLKILPYGDTAVTGNGVTYTPTITPQYDLTDDDFLPSDNQPPITIRRKPTADAYNQVQIEFINRDNDYNIEIAETKDLGSISSYGLRAAEPRRLHAVHTTAVANKVANTQLQRTLYIRNTYEFYLGWRHCLLEPMDIVTLTHAPLGLSLFQVRITGIEEDESGRLRVMAEEFPFGVATPALIQTQPPSGYSVDFNVAPGNANLPVVFEPPLALSEAPEVWIATSGGSETWGGCEVWVSLDNATYKKIGVIDGGARHGTLTATLPSAADPDVSNSLAVDMSVSRGTLSGGTNDDRDLFLTLCYVDGELVSFKNATLTALHKYTLTDLRRGTYGSPIGSHAIGSKFARLDNAIFRYRYTPDVLGKTIYIKLRSFNSYGGAYQELSAVTPTTYAIAGAPVGQISGLALAQPWVSPTLSVKWAPYAGASHYKMEVWVSGLLKRTVDNITTTAFDYRIDDNIADGGPYRAVELRLFAKTATGQSTSPAILVASNPQVAAPAGLSVVASVGQVNIQATTPTDADYAGTIIWAGSATGFVRNDASKVYDGPTPVFSHVVAGGTQKFYRVAHYDKLGKDALNESSELTATSILAGGVKTVSVQPAGTYLDDDVVYYDGDGKLYRWFAGAYTKAASGGDLIAGSVTSDKITVANLAAMSANLGAILSGSVTLDASGYIRGGSTGYMTGAGFWMGYHSGYYKFHIGDPTGQYLAWTGTGLALQSPQLVLNSSGLTISTAQFSLSNGNATFSGNLSAATGSYSGALSGSTGTFAGTLTAGAINAVNTINIAGNAVTIPVSAYDGSRGYVLVEGYSSHPYFQGYVDILAVTLTTVGSAPVYVSAVVSKKSYDNGGVPDPNSSGLYQILRDGAVVHESDMTTNTETVPLQLTDYPAAGPHTYTLRLRTQPYSYLNLNERSIFVMQVKK